MTAETDASGTSEPRDQTEPQGRWEFDEGVTHVFDDMLARSIPQYEVMRQACFDLGSHYVRRSTAVIDLGCSRGEALARFVNRFGAHNRFIGVEVSQPMIEAARERFKGLIECGIVEIRDLDLRTNYPPVNASLTLGVLTVQFVPIEYRQMLIQRAYDHTIAGGAVILVEKVLGASADIDAVMVETYLAMKAANGYTQEQIARKRLSLEGVLVPVTAAWNEELLKQAGFRQVDCFWRWMNFAGWLAVK